MTKQSPMLMPDDDGSVATYSAYSLLAAELRRMAGERHPMPNLTPEQRAEAIALLRGNAAAQQNLIASGNDLRRHTGQPEIPTSTPFVASLYAAVDALEAEPTRDTQIAGLAEYARGLREMLEDNKPCECKEWLCSQPDCGEYHTKVCERCEALRDTFALPLPEAVKVAAENAEKAGLLEWLASQANNPGAVTLMMSLIPSISLKHGGKLLANGEFIEKLRAAKGASK